MKSYKKFFLGLIMAASGALSFAHVDVSLNAGAGPAFSFPSCQIVSLGAAGISVEYEIPMTQRDAIGVGAELESYIIIPVPNLNVSYIRVLSKDLEKSYRWNFESKLCLSAVPYTYESYALPYLRTDFLFEFKPKESGFFFGAGPSVLLCVDPKALFLGEYVAAGVFLQLTAGYRY